MKRFLTTLFLCLCLAGSGLAQQLLKQSTATTINIGPFIDDTDFKTLETALTVTSMTVKVIKQSDTFSSTNTSFAPTASGGSNDAQHVASAMYNLELTTGNTDTVGRLEVVVTIAGALPVFHRFLVAGSTSYDSQVSSVSSIDDLNETDCSTIASTTSPMGRICGNKFLRYDLAGTADSGSTTTVVDTERTEADTDHFANRSYIVFTSGAISGQSAMITAFNAATDTLTFSPALTQAASTEAYEIRAMPNFLRTVPRATAYSDFTFSMVDVTDGQTLETGLTVSGTISKDGGAFSALTNSVTEIGTTGRYKVTLTAAELTADEVYLAFTATGARRVEFKIRPQR